MISAQENAEAHDALLKEGRDARKAGKPMHENPYDYRFEPIAANAWDDGWLTEVGK